MPAKKHRAAVDPPAALSFLQIDFVPIDDDPCSPQHAAVARRPPFLLVSSRPSDVRSYYLNGYCCIRGCLSATLALILLLSMGCGSGAAPDFSLSINPTGQSIQAGSSQQWSIETTALHGFTGTVSVNIRRLPSGITGPGTLALSPGVSRTITLVAANSAQAGSFPISIEGQSGDQIHTLQMTLVVTPAAAQILAFPAAPPYLTLQAGGVSQSIQLTAAPIYGFNSPVTVSVSGCPLRHDCNTLQPYLEAGRQHTLGFKRKWSYRRRKLYIEDDRHVLVRSSTIPLSLQT